ncbi:MAG: hypothetical protein ABIH71_02585 [Candidatus Omnitrophota bacterium]|nr:hypothetical protein [Candidatus Omnitrophota bacterium]
MVGLVKLVGIVIVVLGVVYLIKPVMMQKIAKYWVEGNRLYIASVINILFGIIFFSAAAKCSWPIFIGIMGGLSLLKGVVLGVLGPKKAVPIIEELMKSSKRILRLMAIIVLVFGVFVIYAV